MLWYNTVSACGGPCHCKPEDLNCACSNCGDMDLVHVYESPIDTAQNIINWWLLIILIVWLILWTYLIYRKYKWEKWLRKKFFKRNLIYIFIILVLFIGISFLFWYIKWPFASVGAIPFEN